MAIWNIQTTKNEYVGYSNSGETADEAVTRFITEWPCYASLTPNLHAVRMRQIYVNGGYCKIPAEDAA